MARILDSRTVALEDGRSLRLAGIYVADAAPDGIAVAALRRMLAGHTIGLHASAEVPLDRYGRLRAQVTRDDGLWVQADLIRQGMALVEIGGADDQAVAADLLVVERQARAEGVGQWADHGFALRRPGVAFRLIETFQIVEGPVTAMIAQDGDLLLSLGPNRRFDLTLRIPREALRRFRAAGLDPRRWAGHVVRARGWVRTQYGPMIDVIYPAQIELDPPAS
ncbi:MAG TPA: thermonuclease family protein [Stellaceae bacterium]|nr:thermonuclease family protein [Stellaceae bacterium]